jgi:hypothetical protein
MHPEDDRMFNQVADDRDHYGKCVSRGRIVFTEEGMSGPVYFVSGEPQQRGKFMNGTTGTASTGGKFASAFALGSMVYQREFYKNPNKKPVRTKTG